MAFFSSLHHAEVLGTVHEDSVDLLDPIHMVGDGAALRLSVGHGGLLKVEIERAVHHCVFCRHELLCRLRSFSGLSSLASIKSAIHSKSFLVIVFYSTTEDVHINYHLRGRGKGTCADTGNKQI